MAPPDDAPRVGALEAGGTKCICAVGRYPDDLRQPENRLELASELGPHAIIPRFIEWFAAQHAREPLHAIGIASFGPLDLDSASATWGNITATPKAEFPTCLRNGFPVAKQFKVEGLPRDHQIARVCS
jgi:fructokinase